MSLTLNIPTDIKNLKAPTEGKPNPDRLISGNPQFRTWLLDQSLDGRVRTGLWESTPGHWHVFKDKTYEFGHILEGVVELTEDGGKPVTYRAGDNLVMKPGFRGTWRTVETVRKVFVVAT